MRRIFRRTLPLALRWRVRQLLRRLDDARSRVRFAARRDPSLSSHDVCEYALPLVCYPRQEAAFAAKRSNIDLALRSLDRVVVRPGETLSFWACVGRPTAARGYGIAAAIKDGALTSEVGGAICFVSTLLYNAALLSGMTIVERYCHSVDSYGEARYFELGRDAAVEYAYRDLRARNDFGFDLRLYACLDGDQAMVGVRASQDLPIEVELEIRNEPEDAANDTFAVRTLRRIDFAGTTRTEDLGLSIYRRP